MARVKGKGNEVLVGSSTESLTDGAVPRKALLLPCDAILPPMLSSRHCASVQAGTLMSLPLVIVR